MFRLQRPLTVLGLAFTVVLALSMLAMPVAASELGFDSAPSVAVTGGGQWTVTGLMPGDRLAGSSITIAATGRIRYHLVAETTGSDALVRALHVEIRHPASGDVLYRGNLAGASAGIASSTATGPAGRSLADGQETIQIDGWLPSHAGNEVQGTAVSVAWVIRAVADPTTE